jgi:hypothetical protein
MRKLTARVFDYSLDGLIASEGTEFFQFCRDLPDDPVTLVPYVAGEGAFSSGLELDYRRRRKDRAARLEQVLPQRLERAAGPG